MTVEATAKYLPIEQLPDVTFRYVVLWNNCQGPMLQQLVLEDDAKAWRERGIFTHFVLLPDDPE